MFGLCFVWHCLCHLYFCNHLDGEERAGCFTLLVFLASCECCCSVALLTMLRVGIQCVIVVLPDHTHLPFYCLYKLVANKYPFITFRSNEALPVKKFPETTDAIRSMAVVLVLLVHNLLLLSFKGFCVWPLFRNEIPCDVSSFAIISLRKRELVALLLPIYA